jgi:hypothetical protein
MGGGSGVEVVVEVVVAVAVVVQVEVAVVVVVVSVGVLCGGMGQQRERQGKRVGWSSDEGKTADGETARRRDSERRPRQI